VVTRGTFRDKYFVYTVLSVHKIPAIKKAANINEVASALILKDLLRLSPIGSRVLIHETVPNVTLAVNTNDATGTGTSTSTGTGTDCLPYNKPLNANTPRQLNAAASNPPAEKRIGRHLSPACRTDSREEE
jgi:hypothetical protein